MIAVLLTAVAMAPPAGVVRVAYGVGVDGAPAKTGTLLADGARVETTDRGYGEIQVGPDARVRMSALTRMRVGPSMLSIGSGRVWVQSGRTEVRVDLGGARVVLEPKTSAIVERAPTGLTLAVRIGRGVFEGRGKPVVVGPNQIANADRRGRSAAQVRAGGDAVWDLVVREARSALGDVGRVEAFVISRALRRTMLPSATTVDPFDSYGDAISGADGRASGVQIEGALRPPPFFDDEVPPKGPNVRVDVTFTEE